MAHEAVTLVPFALTVPRVQVTPVPDIVTPLAPAKLVPVMLTVTVVPCCPEVGLIDVSVGPVTVKALLPEVAVPYGVTTLTLLPPVVAVEAMTHEAVTRVSLATGPWGQV